MIGQATFTSSRSLEIEVIVEIENVRAQSNGQSVRERAVDAFFTFVSIDKQGKAQSIPQLEVRIVYFISIFMMPCTAETTLSISFCICKLLTHSHSVIIEYQQGNLQKLLVT